MELVEKSGISYEIIEYLKTPLSKEELGRIADGLNLHPLELIRTKDKLFKELGLSKTDQREAENWLAIIEENPKLLERPIVEYKNKYAMGRPPENILSILEQ